MSENLRTRPRFHYWPLDPARNEIRLLRLLPPLDNGIPKELQPLSCHLEHVSLDDKPTYAALLYVFGAAQPPSFLGVNGQMLQITKNLENALRHLEKSLNCGHVWIDAVCINQGDVEEKSVQVPRMCSLYDHANVVIAWLGPSVDKSDLAMQWISDIGQEVLSYGTLPEILNGCHDETVCQLETRLASRTRAADKMPISPLIKLFGRDFWRRVWIMQEVALAKVLIFTCGRISMNWHLFFAGYWLLQRFGYASRNESDVKWRSLKEAVDQSNYFVNGSYLYKRIYCGPNAKKPLLQLLEVCRQHTRASNPRDMVFALSAMATDWEELSICVDYSKDYEEVFMEVARALIRSGGLNVLFHAQDSGSKNAAVLPSWVPDWTRPMSMTPITKGFSDDRAFSAAGTSLASNCFDRNEDQPRMIVLDGMKVGEVTSIGQIWNSKQMLDSPEAMHRWFADFEDLSRLHAINSNISEENIWQIPIAFRKPETLKWKQRGQVLQESYQILRGHVRPPEGVTNINHWYQDNVTPYMYAMYRTANQRRAFTTNQGHLGLGPGHMQSGDLVCIILGSEVPLVLRRLATGAYTLVGDAYVHGVMHGEYMEDGPAIDVFEIE